MKSKIQKIKEEFFSEPLRYFFRRGFRKRSDIILFLHFNQSFSPFFETAWKICYRPLLEIILKYKEIKFILNFSQSFVENTRNHSEAEILMNKIRSRENIRFSGSYLTQHIPGLLRKDIEEALIPEHGADSIFWLPERSYSEDVLDIISGKGFSSVFAENVTEPVRYRNINIFPDEIYTRYLIDNLVLHGRNKFKLRNHIRKRPLTVYAEDAEVFGLWSYEKGEDFLKPFERLKGFLDWLISRKEVFTVFPDEIKISGNTANEKPVSGSYAAHWIQDIFRGKVNQYFEYGYRDFADFLESPKIECFRQKIEEYYDRLEKNPSIPGFVKKNLLNMMFLNIYEFGCPGIGFEDRYLWAGIEKLDKYIKIYEKNRESVFRQGKLYSRKIFFFEIQDRKIFTDEFGQIITIIYEKDELFITSENYIYLNSHFDSEFPGMFFRPEIFESGEWNIENGNLQFSGSTKNYLIRFDRKSIFFDITSLSPQDTTIELKKGERFLLESGGRVRGEINHHSLEVFVKGYRHEARCIIRA